MGDYARHTMYTSDFSFISQGNEKQINDQFLSTLCDKSDLEDEYHLVLVCPVYDSIRKKEKKKYIHPFYYKRPSVYKFTALMQSKQLLCMRGRLEAGFPRITTLWITLIQILSYYDLAFL